MKTYTAELAPWKMHPLHEAYVARAAEDARRRAMPGPKRHAFETTCPYCGTDSGHLVGVVRVGSKELQDEVPFTREGYLHSLGDIGERDPDVQIAFCPQDECGAAVDPIAYFSPSVFHRLHTCEPEIEDGDEEYGALERP